jgi:hypothetical protein
MNESQLQEDGSVFGLRLQDRFKGLPCLEIVSSNFMNIADLRVDIGRRQRLRRLAEDIFKALQSQPRQMNGLHGLIEQASSVACILFPGGNKFHYVCGGQVSQKAHSKRLLQHDRTKRIDHIGDQFHTKHRHLEPGQSVNSTQRHYRV